MSGHALVCRLDNAGDVLLQGPAIRAVAAASERVTMLCGPQGRAAAELLPGVDEVIVYDAPWVAFEPCPLDREETLSLVDRISGLGADRGIIFTSFHQSPLPLALLLRLAGVPYLAATSVDYPGSLLDVRHRISDSVHEVERSLSLAESAGYRLPPGDSGRLAVRRPARGHPLPFGSEPYVVVHPGVSVPARAWPPARHAELVDELVQRGWRVAVTGAPGERELTARVAGAERPEVADLGGRTTLAELAEVIAGAAAIAVGNTGPAHLAAAVGTPVVSLFAPTVPAVRWRPWRVPHALLYRDVPCAGCRARRCPVEGHPCLSGVTAGEVLKSIERLARVREEVAG
ncbi:glycosyltransferase family 9 protein [Rubrobacter taiwanensis]|jgi:ADP-heptose:LPS heptosyltransferase|uniref:Glycosyltransferase family 9 protein n=1 Tax=Rubrobacter taiwanensis TaxID=185139 RepID=A0A4R1BHT6_9ACTN|nr:glycosyltransferase family 9 protein [Rubrobacter taiwanensis]TCJ16836.1 glycosyltransferase family 9 protein [Rubrobacter taiwanensis]